MKLPTGESLVILLVEFVIFAVGFSMGYTFCHMKNKQKMMKGGLQKNGI